MKYQLRVEQVSIRIKLKNTTNFVRRLATLLGLPAGGTSMVRNARNGAMVSSIGLVDKVIHVFREFDAQEPRGLKINRDPEPVNRDGLGR